MLGIDFIVVTWNNIPFYRWIPFKKHTPLKPTWAQCALKNNFTKVIVSSPPFLNKGRGWIFENFAWGGGQNFWKISGEWKRGVRRLFSIIKGGGTAATFSYLSFSVLHIMIFIVFKIYIKFSHTPRVVCGVIHRI